MNPIPSIVRSVPLAVIVAAICALSPVSSASAQIIIPATPTTGGELPKIERKIDAKAKAIYDRAQAEMRKLSSIQFDGRIKFGRASCRERVLYTV